MSTRFRLWALLALIIGTISGLAALQTAQACGGFFCQNTPVDQNAERIIFAHNRDGTLSTYIQIQYTGSAPDFSWILPLPAPIGPEDVEVPEDAMAAFTELEVATDPVFIPPELPQCAVAAIENRPTSVPMAVAESMSVEVYASGEVGPYGFDVVGSEDPDALIGWLRDYEYRVTEPMEPLIDLYVKEQFVFLAMRLLPDQGAQDVQPVKVTYPSANPMIPLRLTAVAANPDMAVMVWVYADQPAVPMNYADLEIADTDLTFFTFGGNNYRQLMSDGADEFRGQAFVTEYAAPSRELAVVHPLLQELRDTHPYVTRLNTVISPEEMTVDPIFDYDPQRKDVSNIRDLSDMTGLFDCERQEAVANQVSTSTKVAIPEKATEVPAAASASTEEEENPTAVAASRNDGAVSEGSKTAGPAGPASLPGGEGSAQDVSTPALPWLTLVGAGAIGAALVLLVAGLVVLAIMRGRWVRG